MWEKVEERLGLGLPTDYKEFITLYGSGRISKFVWIFNPLSKRKNINLFEQVERQLSALRTLSSEFREQCPYKLFPASGGLLPVGLTDNGDVLHWLTSESPSNWSVVVNASRGPEYQRFDHSLSTFLVRILTRK